MEKINKLVDFKSGISFHKRKLTGGAICIYILLAIFSVVVLLPFFYLITTSFKTFEDITAANAGIFSKTNNFIANWNMVFGAKNYYFVRSFLNTMVVFLLKASGVLLTCSFAAYGFARFKCKLNTLVFMLFVAIMFLPGELLGIPFYEAMVALNLRYSSLYIPLWIGAWAGIDITVIFLFRQFFLSTPSTLVDAAKIDGCSEASAFFRIVLPLAKSVIITVIILYFIGTYNDIYSPNLYISANNYKAKLVSQTIGIIQGVNNPTGNFPQWNLVSVATLVSIAPILLFFSVAQKYFVESFVGSGIKG